MTANHTFRDDAEALAAFTPRAARGSTRLASDERDLIAADRNLLLPVRVLDARLAGRWRPREPLWNPSPCSAGRIAPRRLRVASRARRDDARARRRLAAGAICALLAVAALAAGHGEFSGAVSRGALAALGRGSRNTQASKARGEDGDWLLGGGPEAPALGKSKKAPKSSAVPRRLPGLHNAEGALPGLVEHVSKKTDTTRFRMITFCNQAYWPFSHGMLQSMQFVAPALIPFWTVIVADEPTRQFVMKQAPGVDVFVDRDLQDIVASAGAPAIFGSLTKLLLATHARPAQPHPGGFHRCLPRAGRGVHEESAAAVSRHAGGRGRGGDEQLRHRGEGAYARQHQGDLRETVRRGEEAHRRLAARGGGVQGRR